MTSENQGPQDTVSPTQGNTGGSELEKGMRFGEFVVLERIGEGRGGGLVYAAIQCHQDLKEGMLSYVSPTAVLKYPVPDMNEVETMKLLSRRPQCLGVPKIYDSGVHLGKNWIVMDMLRHSFDEVLEPQHLPAKSRWQLLQVLGRLLLRRLQAIHTRGFVHCDVQPENILIGRVEGACTNKQDRWAPFFIDFGLARRFPDGPRSPSHHVTLEYASIRTAEGGVRSPADDLESLGWVLCFYVGGDLPWFQSIRSGDWENKTWRAEMIWQVQREKIESLKDGAHSLQNVVPDIPSDLVQYLRLCHQFGKGDKPLDYVALYRLLGWNNETSDSLAEIWDLAFFRRLCEAQSSDTISDPLVLAREDFAISEREFKAMSSTYFVAGSWSNWAMQRMTKDKAEQGMYWLEIHLPQDGGEFQIVRNRDWKQVFYPACRHASCTSTKLIEGPDSNGSGFHWEVMGVAGDIIVIKFFPTKLSDGGISWRKLEYKPLPEAVLRTLPPSRYFVVGSWDKWKHKHKMINFGRRHIFVVTVGNTGQESFQILLDENWTQRLYPDVKDASTYVTHELKGPEHAGSGFNWTVGKHTLDWAAPGNQVEIRLLIRDGIPVKVEWSRV